MNLLRYIKDGITKKGPRTVEVLDRPVIKAAIELEKLKDDIQAQLASLITSTKTWETMNMKERKICVKHTVTQVESELELSRQLNEIGCTNCAINWCDIDPNDKSSFEAQVLVKALGGLVSKSGALVRIMTVEDGMF